ncbi:hypothetical protein [Acidocella aminolytica]|uniref:hypothetical protein n=1 Tax=Acidocella aminolytica TaxID=33998 RepID=UPI001114D073|nr:hypothetical protein [Acidocella aminolytica]
MRSFVHLLLSAVLLFGSVTAFAHSDMHTSERLVQNIYRQSATPRETGNFRGTTAHSASQCLNTACETQNIGPVSALLPLPLVKCLASAWRADGTKLSGITPDQESPPPKITVHA